MSILKLGNFTLKFHGEEGCFFLKQFLLELVLILNGSILARDDTNLLETITVGDSNLASSTQISNLV